MLIARIVSIFAMVSAIGAHSVSAQNLSEFQTPAEFPPSSYTAKQYVDSRGCVYIRAGIDGAVTWVPRVNRDRKPVCGFKPTGVQSATAAQSPATKPVPEIKLEPPSSTAGRAVPPPVVAPKSVASGPTPRVQPTGVQPRQSTSVAIATPRVSPSAQRAKAVATPAVSAGSATARCPDGSLARQDYVNQKGQRVLVCPVASRAAAAVAKPAKVAPAVARDPNARTLPRAVYSDRLNAAKVRVPVGYRSVWEDDRLNPHRGEQGLQPAQLPRRSMPAGYRNAWDDGRLNPNRGNTTAAGQASMDSIWTQTVPRKLVKIPVPSTVTVVTNGTVSAVYKPVRLSTRSQETSARIAPRALPVGKR